MLRYQTRTAFVPYGTKAKNLSTAHYSPDFAKAIRNPPNGRPPHRARRFRVFHFTMICYYNASETDTP